jgi:hypothetical protein
VTQLIEDNSASQSIPQSQRDRITQPSVGRVSEPITPEDFDRQIIIENCIAAAAVIAILLFVFLANSCAH